MRRRWFVRLLGYLLLLAPALRVPGQTASPNAGDAYARAAAEIRAGVQAYTARDYAAFLTHTQAAVDLRGDHPTYRYYLAAAHALLGEAAPTAAVLQSLVRDGLYVPAATEADFDPVRATPAVAAALAALEDLRTPRGEAPIAFALPAQDGLWEGITHDAEHDVTYLADLHHATIVARDARGDTRRFAEIPDRGFGCGGMALDPARGLLWVSSPALPEVASFLPDQTGQSRLYAFRLDDGRLARVVRLPLDEVHAVVDLTVARDGTVYASDSTAPIIWRIAAESAVAEPWGRITAPGLRHSLQGLALTADDRWLVVADYSTGLHRVDTATGFATFLTDDALPAQPPCLVGLDGLAIRGDEILAVQNGVEPHRVLRIGLRYRPAASIGPTVTAIQVLASGHPQLADPTLVTATGTGFLAIGEAGWSYFGASAAPAPSTRTVPVLGFQPTPTSLIRP